MMQDAYDHQDNWFASPKFYNNLDETGVSLPAEPMLL